VGVHWCTAQAGGLQIMQITCGSFWISLALGVVTRL
jgi:hypothetical protein